MTTKTGLCIKSINRVDFDFMLTLKAFIGCDSPPHSLQSFKTPQKVSNALRSRMIIFLPIEVLNRESVSIYYRNSADISESAKCAALNVLEHSSLLTDWLFPFPFIPQYKWFTSSNKSTCPLCRETFF